MNPHHQETIRLTDHPAVVTERHPGPQPRPYPGIAPKVRSQEGTRQTCEIYWRTKQGNPDPSMDHVGAPRPTTNTVVPDTITPAGSNTADSALSSCVAISLNTGAPHTRYASLTK